MQGYRDTGIQRHWHTGKQKYCDTGIPGYWDTKKYNIERGLQGDQDK